MDEELEAEAVLDLLLEHLDTLSLAEPDRPQGYAQLVEGVNAAIADHPNNTLRQAGAALAVVTAYGTSIDQEEFEQILSQLRRIEGLESIQDVHYVGLGPRREIEVSLRSLLPGERDIRLDEEERRAIDRFIGSALDVDFGPPDNGKGRFRP